MYNSKQKQNKKYWIVCDGPVDTIWIESLNTVLDDNKILTLPNGDRFPMAETVKLVFEVQDLNNASPATVSRCGIVYVSQRDLGYAAVIQTYLQKRKKKDTKLIQDLIEQYVIQSDIFMKVEKKMIEPIMKINIYTTICNILRILNGLLTECSVKNKVMGGDDPKV